MFGAEAGAGVPSQNTRSRERGIFWIRVATALLQAAALYWLADAATPVATWPATDPRVFEPMLLASVCVPLAVLFGLGQLGGRAIAIWAAIVALTVIGLGYHDATRGQIRDFISFGLPWPRVQVCWAVAAGLFIAQALVIVSVVEQRLFPYYALLFETAWKQGVQTVFSLVFVGVFWGVLFLGAELFKLVDIRDFERLIEHRWFAIPATTLAVAVAIHVTDVQPSLIRGVRSVALALFSWLLPLLAAIVVGFLCTLPFISLEPLWKTHFATGLLLTAAGALVFLINAHYQDGAAVRPALSPKKLAATLGAIALVPLVALAIWGLALRVGQYGWTVQRVFAAAFIIVASCYALGYATATVGARRWLARLEITNLLTAYVGLALILMLFSPVADPARLVTASQVARLESGAVKPAAFDFVTLKFDGARWGNDALQRLSRTASGPDAETIAASAKHALAAASRFDRERATTPQEIASRIDVYPAGRDLPSGLLDLAAGPLARAPSSLLLCLHAGAQHCIARFVTLHPGEAEAILLLDNLSGYVFETDASGLWRQTARFEGPMYCKTIRDAIAAGSFALDPHTQPDVVIGAQRFVIGDSRYDCPSASSPKP